jgi:hypothetical protein
MTTAFAPSSISAYQIPPRSSTIKNVIEFIETKFKDGSQYFALTNVSQAKFREPESKREDFSLPRMRVQYIPDHIPVNLSHALQENPVLEGNLGYLLV